MVLWPHKSIPEKTKLPGFEVLQKKIEIVLFFPRTAFQEVSNINIAVHKQIL